MYRGRGSSNSSNIMVHRNRNRNKPRQLDARDIIRGNSGGASGSGGGGGYQHDNRYGPFDDNDGWRYGKHNNARGRGKSFQGRARANTTSGTFQRSAPEDSSFKVTVFNGARFLQNEIITIIKRALGDETNIPFFHVSLFTLEIINLNLCSQTNFALFESH